MKLALIPPLSRLEDTQRTNYQLCLAHLAAAPVIELDDYWRTYYELCQDNKQFVILDNGAFEGSMVDIDTLMKLAKSMQPQEVVIPDQIGNAEETIDLAQDFYDVSRSYGWSGRNMFVAQGSDVPSLYSSIKWAMRQQFINTIALPKHTLRMDKYIRLEAAAYISNHSEKQIHFLGASPLWPDEFVDAGKHPYIRGMDTSMPYVYGMHELTLPAAEPKNRPDDYFNHPMDAMQNHLADKNIMYMLNRVAARV